MFILTHHAREPVTKQGGTTFTFVTDGIEAALEQAEAAAGDKDVAIGGGASVAQQYLKAGLLDEFQLHVVPVFLGDGVRLFENLGPDQPRAGMHQGRRGSRRHPPQVPRRRVELPRAYPGRMAKEIDRERLHELLRAEEERFVERAPALARAVRARQAIAARRRADAVDDRVGRRRTPCSSPRPSGAHFTDVDGNEYVDFCLGDTGAMTGHSPAGDGRGDRRAGAPRDHADAADRGLDLGRRGAGRRFGLPYWQFALTATDANRFTIRLARAITGRPKVLVYSWCYHGTVDETFAIAVDGETRSRPDNIGPPVDPAVTTKAVEWNDVEALEAALASGDVACVLAEPAMTNIGIVLPEPGYHDALRALTREHGTLLVIDETHTICAGPGGYTAAHEPRAGLRHDRQADRRRRARPPPTG